MSDRLFDIEDVPEVPLFRPPRRARGAQIMDERIGHDYPPEWGCCQECGGSGCEACKGMGSVKARVRLEAGHRCVRCGHPFMPKGDAKMLGVEPSPGRWSPCDGRCTHDGPIRWRIKGQETWMFQEYRGPDYYRGGIEEVEAEWRVLTVHHLDGDKANLRWWNLLAACQRCHLYIQAKVVLERVYPHEHSEWFKLYVAAYYAWVYLGEDLTREETMARLDELLALELAPA